LGVLLQRIISLETRYGDQFAPKVAWGQHRPATMERKLLSKSSVLFWPGRPTASGGILLRAGSGHKQTDEWREDQFPITAAGQVPHQGLTFPIAAFTTVCCWLEGHWQARSRKIANVAFSSSTLDE